MICIFCIMVLHPAISATLKNAGCCYQCNKLFVEAWKRTLGGGWVNLHWNVPEKWQKMVPLKESIFCGQPLQHANSTYCQVNPWGIFLGLSNHLWLGKSVDWICLGAIMDQEIHLKNAGWMSVPWSSYMWLSHNGNPNMMVNYSG